MMSHNCYNTINIKNILDIFMVTKNKIKKSLDIANITNNDGCFDLQFRKDTRHERLNSSNT